ncbi:MAG: CRISPR-associated protein Cas4 [Magnetococcales bacterium]|nr:CRISPR-associated protein Cas4 [Magnetococcales bacterium]
MFEERDLLPISALQHFLFCPRQCALIHLEQQWAENRWTAEGRVLHGQADLPAGRTRKGVRVVTALPIRSLELGVAGVADVVEFHRETGGRWAPFPVEYKRGRKKQGDWDRVQLCAQAMALEEMTGQAVPAGALYYGQARQREAVDFDESLRNRTRAAARGLRDLLAAGVTPAPAPGVACAHCSMEDLCLPDVVHGPGRVAAYYRSVLDEDP